MRIFTLELRYGPARTFTGPSRDIISQILEFSERSRTDLAIGFAKPAAKRKGRMTMGNFIVIAGACFGGYIFFEELLGVGQ